MEPPKPTVSDAFRKAVDLLEAEGVPFVLIGGIAASLQGEPRVTEDVDFLVTLTSTRVQGLAARAREVGFDIDPEMAETQWHFGQCVRLWLGPTGSQTAVDFMACSSDFLKQVAWRAVQVRCMRRSVPVASAEDLLLLKLAAWRAKDLPDTVAIVARHRDRLDLAYLRKWASWLAQKHSSFRDAPLRLEALLAEKPLPPPQASPRA